LATVTAGYRLWLAKQPLSVNPRRTYLGRVRQYCAYLETSANDYGDPLSDPHAPDYAIRDFKTNLKKARKAKPASVNLMLAALDHLYLFLGLGRQVTRPVARPSSSATSAGWRSAINSDHLKLRSNP
jgi:integrase/recombinase XerC